MSANDIRALSVGFVGCGDIVGAYVAGLRGLPGIRLARCAARSVEHARAAASAAGIPSWGTTDQLLADPDIDVAVILTPAATHGALVVQAVQSGKHVYTEKPLSASLDEAKRVLESAARANRLVGAAPDTFLGSAGQTARWAIDGGAIGEVIGASAFIVHTRSEEWHPHPEQFFAPGGGPALDMGPYAVSALINCLGPIRTVSAMSRIGSRTRSLTSPDRAVDSVQVSVPTHDVAILGFESGPLASVLMSFDVWPGRDGRRSLPNIEIYGSLGALSLPDPNHFDGDVRLKLNGDDDWTTLPARPPLFGQRGLGIADLAGAIRGEPHRTSGQFAYHVLEALIAIQDSGGYGATVHLESQAERPSPIGDDLPRFTVQASSQKVRKSM